MPVIHSLFTPDIEKMRRSGDIDGLIRVLRNHETADLRKVELALISLGDISVGPLIAALKDPDRRVREAAVNALGALKSPRAARPLIDALNDEEWHIRFLATLGLVEMGKDVVDDLVSALRTGERDIRLGAAWALGEIRDGRAVTPLIGALEDADPLVREAAIWGLGEIRDRTAVEPLVQMLRDPLREIRQNAAWALGEIKDDRSIEPLVKALEDTEYDVRFEAALALVWTKEGRITDRVMDALRDGDVRMRRNAAQALGELGDIRAFEVLVHALRDGERDVRLEATKALGALGDPRGCDPLNEVLNDLEDTEVQRSARESLASIRKACSPQAREI